MPIQLVTGLPGAGKSLRLVQLIKGFLDAGRNVYVHGLDGLQPFGWEPCNPREWQSLPDGSVVVVDEAQKVWPTRRSGDPPEDVRALSEHRHHGFDFVLATQHPTMVDSYVRKLVNGHEHVLRQFGAKIARIITWAECQDDPQALGTRQRGQEAMWKYPSDCFDLYKSATMHTVKRKLPFRVAVIPVLVVLAVVLGWAGIRSLGFFSSADPGKIAAEGVHGGAVDVQEVVAKPKTPEQYASFQLPRLKSQPWSSMLFDDRKAQAQPELYCASMERGPCRCITDQGTSYDLEDRACRHIARHGQYNPFRKPFQKNDKRAPDSAEPESRSAPQAQAQPSASLSAS